MAKILILEDDVHRVRKFHWKLVNHTLTVFDNANAFKAFLKENHESIDVILLDHDLEGRQFVPSSEENTGYAVAKFIKEAGYKFQQIIIHSMNPYGAEAMYNVLKDSAKTVEKIPFPILIESIDSSSSMEVNHA